MLTYDSHTTPGLVALYDIRPGNRAGQFLQPWSPHGAPIGEAGFHGLDCSSVHPSQTEINPMFTKLKHKILNPQPQ